VTAAAGGACLARWQSAVSAHSQPLLLCSRVGCSLGEGQCGHVRVVAALCTLQPPSLSPLNMSSCILRL
jgi:hypothetical protein